NGVNEDDGPHENLFKLWLTESLIDALEQDKPDIYQPNKTINKFVKQARFYYPRSAVLSKLVKHNANYKCAVDPDHKTFVGQD
ncbi:hypothetical protein, partial [Pseudoalteromonas sp. Q36-MNA-CIBAN-0048]|uniref:hypothetical protein n=1 Tax=Pseudoalteromonas sp. Q36-MNA-CIBAN-0048 TaxID=3140479 RepID=UPI0033237C32